MIIRLVKMEFQPQKREDFVSLFLKRKKGIESQQGCHSVKLFNDVKDKSIFFTYSIWDSQDDLEVYRNSDFFRETWSITKTFFADKPKAWSVKETPMPTHV